jgi:hypothetical protein
MVMFWCALASLRLGFGWPFVSLANHHENINLKNKELIWKAKPYH